MDLLACQIQVPRTRRREDQLAHLQALRHRLMAACRERTPDLIVLPELAAQEYGDAAFACLDALDDDGRGPVVAHFTALARELGCPIAFGGARRDGARRHICQWLVDADGRLLGAYDKLHCAQFGASGEAAHFAPGDHLLVTEVAGWRVGVLICYDLRFPELARRLADAGVELILHPVAFTRDFSFPSWHAFAVTRAMETQSYWLSLNRAGEGWGHSVLCPPLMDETRPVTAFGEGEALRWLRLERAAVAAARARLPLGRDRRADLASLPCRPPD